MPADYSAAIDELYGIVKAVFDNNSNSLFGYSPVVYWPGIGTKEKPNQTNLLWARVSDQLVKENQDSLSDHTGTRKFCSTGLLYVQLFCPKSVAGVLDSGLKLALKLRDEFCKPSPSRTIWFRDQKVVKLPAATDNYPINVVVTFEFETFK